MRAGPFEHRPGAVEVGPQAQIEVGLGRAADHPGEVEDRIDFTHGGDGVQAAGDQADPRIAADLGRRLGRIEQDEFVHLDGGATTESVGLGEQVAGQQGAQKARPHR